MLLDIPLELLLPTALFIICMLCFFYKSPLFEGQDKSKALVMEESLTPQPHKEDLRVLNPATFKKFKLIQTVNVSHNTKLLRFEIESGKALSLPIGRHISVMVHLDGQKIIRPYTPVSRPDELGHFELLIKSYANGKMSSYLCGMSEGEMLEVRGPVGRFKYTPNMYKRMGLICGGTGLTPCLQVASCILEGEHAEEEETCLTLMYQNRTEEDILLRKRLEHLKAKYPTRFEVLYFLSNPPKSWGKADNEFRGYIDEDAIMRDIRTKECQHIGICGPSGFNEKMVEHLVAVGYEKDKNIYIW